MRDPGYSADRKTTLYNEVAPKVADDGTAGTQLGSGLMEDPGGGAGPGCGVRKLRTETDLAIDSSLVLFVGFSDFYCIVEIWW
jgi:hypothetical protein